MELAMISKLIDAGYTKADIDAMETPTTPETPPTHAPTAQQIADKIYRPLEAPPVQATQTPQAPPVQTTPDVASQQIEAINKLITQMSETSEAIKLQAIRSTSMPELESADDIAALIIDPYAKEGK